MTEKIVLKNLGVVLTRAHDPDSVPHHFRGEYDGKRVDPMILSLPPCEKKTGYQKGDRIKLLCGGEYHLFTIHTAEPALEGPK